MMKILRGRGRHQLDAVSAPKSGSRATQEVASLSASAATASVRKLTGKVNA